MGDQRKGELTRKLMDEIINIEVSAAAIGVPQTTEQRSLIARYGKLLLITQDLLGAISQLRGREELSYSMAEHLRSRKGRTGSLARVHPAISSFRRVGRL
ncbi:MAG: hypothetical protein GY703_04050 [Gammaproteobacteria bacterium]|nr:hypothetical protein [Gammaproteobacteria bacterium]